VETNQVISRSRATRVWFVALATLALILLPSAPALPTDPPRNVLVFGTHPDDDVIIAGGVAYGARQAGDTVTIALLTNGDKCADAACTLAQGTTRQGEAVDAQALILGQADENDIVFLGYPAGHLINPTNPNDLPPLTETYASRGLGRTDWYDYRTPGTGKAAYTKQNMQADVTALVDTYRPDEIYTHSPFDRLQDHQTAYRLMVQAVANVQDSDPTYQPYIYSAVVHTFSEPFQTWPDMNWSSPNWAGPATANGPMLNALDCAEGWPECDSAGELVWDQRAALVVPAAMQNTVLANNPKSQAIEAHVSQVPPAAANNFIRRSIRKDEVFWVIRVGSAEGKPDSGYAVAEGGTLAVTGSGVLKNDVRGVGATPGATVWTTNELGPMSAVLVNDVSNGTLTLNSDGSFTYTHDGSETSTDSFTYRPVQGATNGSTTTVSITINPVDDAPTAAGEGPYDVDNGALLSVAAPGVLANDSDPESLALTAVLVGDVSNGSLSLNTDGSFTYTHNGSATQSDSFTYRAKDPGGNLSALATVSINIVDTSQPIDVSVNGPTFGASGLASLFGSATSGGSGSVRYAWSVERSGMIVATGSGATFEFTPSLGGPHTVKLTVTDDAGSDSTETNMTVLTDIAASGFAANILWLAEAGITKGCNPPANDEFCPDAPVTRGAMAAFLVRFLGLTDDGGGNTFTDDNDSIFETDIAKLAAAGITLGCNPPTNDRFCPNDPVTRGAMAAFLSRALGLTDDGGGNTFTDDDGSIFEADIAKLAAAGITLGCNPPTNDRFCPEDSVTRGQMAAFLDRANDIASS
jgi:VCBS repeat-containing protein